LQAQARRSDLIRQDKEMHRSFLGQQLEAATADVRKDREWHHQQPKYDLCEQRSAAYIKNILVVSQIETMKLLIGFGESTYFLHNATKPTHELLRSIANVIAN